MADESRTIIVDIETDIDVQLGDINKEIDENRKQLKELRKDYDANAKGISKLERKNQDLSKTKRELIKDYSAEKGSLNELRRTLANQVQDRNKLNISTEEGRKKFEEMNVSIKKLNDEISGFEQAGGDFRRNVGNYPQLLGQAAGGVRVFGTSLSDVFNLIRANPIILLVSAIAGLIKAFSESQAGAEFFRKTAAALNAAIGLLKDIVEDAGVALIEAFEKPQETLDNLVNTIKGGIVNYFTQIIPKAIANVIEGFGLLGKAAKLIFEGEFSEALTVATAASGKLLDGVTDIIPATLILKETVKAAAPAIAEFSREVKTAADAAFGLERRLIANEKALADQQVVVAQSIKSQKELNLLIEDQSASFQDRIDAANEFARVEQEQINESIRLQEERIEILKAQNALTNSTEEDIQRVRDAEIELANLQAASFERQVTNQNKLNTILTQQRTEQQKAAAEEAKQKASNKKKEADDELKLAKLKRKVYNDGLTAVVNLAGQGSSIGKVAAVGSVIRSSAEGIAGAVKAAQSVPFPFNIAAAGAGIAQVGSVIAQAKQILASDPSQTLGSSGGGGISAPSVSVSGGGLANVNAGLLSQFSTAPEAGAAQSESFSEAVSKLPPPEVSVVEITEAQSAREVKTKEASLG